MRKGVWVIVVVSLRVNLNLLINGIIVLLLLKSHWAYIVMIINSSWNYSELLERWILFIWLNLGRWIITLTCIHALNFTKERLILGFRLLLSLMWRLVLRSWWLRRIKLFLRGDWINYEIVLVVLLS